MHNKNIIKSGCETLLLLGIGFASAELFNAIGEYDVIRDQQASIVINDVKAKKQLYQVSEIDYKAVPNLVNKYHYAKTAATRIAILNKLYDLHDYTGLKCINKQYPSTYTHLVLNAALFNFYQTLGDSDKNATSAKTYKLFLAKDTYKVLQDLPLKNKAVNKKYQLLNMNIKQTLSDIKMFYKYDNK